MHITNFHNYLYCAGPITKQLLTSMLLLLKSVHFLHKYLYLGVSRTTSSLWQQNWWYHSLHKAHCTSAHLTMCAVLSLFQGSRQIQNMGTSFMCTKYALPNRCVAPGVWKGKRQPLSTQPKKLDLILDWSYFSVWGSSPEHKDVANAIANSPQSLLPTCRWTWTCFTVKEASSVFIMAAICLCKLLEFMLHDGRLSYTSTIPGDERRLEAQTQWFPATLISWTKSSSDDW